MKKLFFILSIMITYSCSEKKNQTIDYYDCTKSNDVEDCILEQMSYNSLSKDEKSAIEKTIDLYLWYCENVEVLDQDALVVFNNSLNIYTLNNEHAENYISRFQKSGLVSDVFINKLNKKFSEYGEYLIQEQFPAEEEMVGYNADIIMHSQDPVFSITRELVEIYKLNVYKEKIIVTLFAPNIKSELVKDKNDQWIINDFYGY